jgi:hypothetical protein
MLKIGLGQEFGGSVMTPQSDTTSQFRLISIVFLTLTFCGGAASADDVGKIIIGRAFYQCLAEDNPIQMALLDEIKKQCEGQLACDVNDDVIR